MTHLIRLAAVATLGLGGMMATVETSSAMPLTVTPPIASALVQDVAWGCGPGWQPNPWGRCVPNGGPVYYGYGRRGPVRSITAGIAPGVGTDPGIVGKD